MTDLHGRTRLVNEGGINVTPIPFDQRVLILGSSPSMPQYSKLAFDNCGTILTANAGCYECMFRQRIPQVFATIEVDSPKLFGRYYRKFREGGTKILTIDLSLANDPGLAREADIIIDILPKGQQYGNIHHRKGCYSDVTPYVRGSYAACSASGGYLLQYAMNHYAPLEVWLIGMEGYRSTPTERVVDTFDGRLGNKAGQEWTERLYGPLIQQVVNEWPETKFIFFGKLEYPVEGDNVVKRCDPPVEDAVLTAERIR